MYCPGQAVTRAQMAVFLLRGKHGSGYAPPAASGSVFGDVPAGYWAGAWIEQLAAEGITGGCGGGDYCPEQAVTRDQMAVFLLRARHGSGYAPPPASGTMFGDVPAGQWAAGWIEQLVVEGITSGCGAGAYCPAQAVTRDQMAVFLVRTFSLP
jgi:anti-sigma factor RsiW